MKLGENRCEICNRNLGITNALGICRRGTPECTREYQRRLYLKTRKLTGRRRLQIPVGSRYEQLVTISETFTEPQSANSQQKISFVMVRCDCGKELKIPAKLWGKNEKCKACANKKRRFLGDDHPRQPFVYRKICLERQNYLCAWPLCGKPLNEDDEIHVDHNARVSPGPRANLKSIRGAVHSVCNTVAIKSADWALNNGFIAPPEIEAYLRTGEDHGSNGLNPSIAAS